MLFDSNLFRIAKTTFCGLLFLGKSVSQIVQKKILRQLISCILAKGLSKEQFIFLIGLQ